MMNDGAHIDALVPREMALKAEEVGLAKVRLPPASVFVLAVLAGAFIGLGAMLSTVVSAGLGPTVPFGLARLAAGVVFSVGLILVVVGGAELFTGNNLIVMAWASRRVSTRDLLVNWVLVYAGNLAGALLTAGLVFMTEQHALGAGSVGAAALAVAETKCSLGLLPALARGALCNALVCLAVWLCLSARSTTDRILCVVPPVTAFVAAGFEHSIANMYFVPMAILIRRFAGPGPWLGAAGPGAFPHVDVTHFLVHNLVPVTLGNLAGGAGMVGIVYWFVYLRDRTRS
jgi:formate transporter